VKLTAAVLTISDSSHRGSREDLSGPRLQHCLNDAGFEVVLTRVLPDDAAQIVTALREAAAQATRAVCDRLIEGVAEQMRVEGLKKTKFAALSRGVCGTLGSSLVLNLPGSPGGAEQSLKSVLHLVPHALDLLAGKTEHS